MTTALSMALRARAAGLLPDEAATCLLISHGGFLHREDFTAFVRTAPSISDGTMLAWIDWDAVTAALDHGQLPLSSGERRILQLTASLAAGTPVTLREAIPGLDQHNLRLITTAIRHAAGQHHH
ncbi:MAG: hypothetical protein JOZ09_11760 [Pseudonocardiales bacterium]|nr:hypothetical protein [Pseudonocardiales bacterium]